jgi:acetoin utilization protein AcuB
VTALVSEEPGTIAALTTAIAQEGGNIVSLGTFPGDDPSTGICTIKVADVPRERLSDVIRPQVIRIMDIREA